MYQYKENIKWVIKYVTRCDLLIISRTYFGKDYFYVYKHVTCSYYIIHMFMLNLPK